MANAELHRFAPSGIIEKIFSKGVNQNMETAAIRALILSLCAGMSTLLGALVVMVIKKSEKLVSIS